MVKAQVEHLQIDVEAEPDLSDGGCSMQQLPAHVASSRLSGSTDLEASKTFSLRMGAKMMRISEKRHELQLLTREPD